MSLAESVLQIIEDAAREQAFARVTAVWLEIGELSCVEAEAMKFCFDAVVRDTLAAGARLEIIAVPGAGWCPQCAKTVPVGDALGECPECGDIRVRVTGGTEMRVKELEVV